jgi:peptide/nickel transport system ATP-binding protein
MILRVENLSVSYYMEYGKIEAVKNVTFDLEKGEILSIIGESGSGKSTLAKAILRAIRYPGKVEEGSKIFFNDTDILSMKESDFKREILWKRISYVPQSSQNSLNNTMRVIDHFYDTAVSHGMNDREEVKRTAKELLKMVRLDPDRVGKAYPFQLSGGMKQRVIIALSLLLNPELIIMDEAVSSLDVATQRYILEIIKDINKKTGVSIIFITHDISIAAFISSRIIVMYAGEIMEEGKTEEVIKNPLHPYTAGLINSVPSINSNVSQIKPIKEGYASIEGCPFNTRCEKAMEICKLSEPPIYNVNNRKVRCFLYGDNKA